MVLFKTFKSWKNYILSAIQNVFVGLLRIVYAFVNGAISLIVGVFRSIGAFARREPRAMFVIVVLYVILFFVLLKWG